MKMCVLKDETRGGDILYSVYKLLRVNFGYIQNKSSSFPQTAEVIHLKTTQFQTDFISSF